MKQEQADRKKMKIIFMTVIFCLTFTVFNACNKTKSAADIQQENFFLEFHNHTSQALSLFADENTILSAIAYIDDLITKGEHKINNILYTKARLLCKLGQYDEAVNLLIQANNSVYDIDIATLLIYLNRNDEASPYLQNNINANKRKLLEISNNQKNENLSIEMINMIQGSIILYILEDRSYEYIIHELTSLNITTQQNLELLLQDLLVETQTDLPGMKELIINGNWN